MKKILFILMGLLLTISITLNILNLITIHSNQDKTELADKIFMANLSFARSYFAKDYSTMNADDKINFYLQLSSNLGTAMNMIDLTSYNNSKNRNELFDAIYSLYWCITRSDSRDTILNNRALTIYKCLTKIIQNPQDKKDCQTIAKIAGDLYFNHTENNSSK